MNSSCSFWLCASDASVSASRRSKSEAITSTMPTTPPEEPPESTVYLDITEIRPGEAPVDLFHGWMFASSPALNGLEHPVYDVWVLECQVLAAETLSQE